MAKFVFSPLVSDARGKFGNAVFSANGSGAYLRELVRPTNPRTPKQMGTRATFGQISQAWRGLTQEQRQAWNLVVPDYIQQDVFGRDVQLSGFQLFSKLNNSLQQIGSPGINDPLPPQEFTPVILSATAFNNQLRVIPLAEYNDPVPNAVPDGTVIVVSATRVVSAGKMSAASNEFRQIAVLPAGTVLPDEALLGAYTEQFGGEQLPADGKLFVRTQQVVLANGQRTVPFVTEVIVVQNA